MAKKTWLIIAVVLTAALALLLFAACTPNEGVEIENPDMPYANVVAVRIDSVKTVCYLGESFDFNDYKVLLELKSGEVVEEVLSAGHTSVDAEFIDVDQMFFYKIGTTTFSVRYGAAQTTYTVEVKVPDVVGASLYAMPNKTEYIEGERLTMDGCRLALKLNTGSTIYASVGDGFVTGFDSSSLGEKTLKINYSGFVVEIKINVRAKRINNVELDTLPEVKSYVVAKDGSTVALQTAGMKFKISYDNGTSEVVSASELSEDTVVYNYDFGRADAQSPVIATYNDRATGLSYRMSFTVAVSNRQPISLTIENRPTDYDNVIEGAADMNYAGGTIRIRFTDDPNGEGEIIPMTSPVFTKKGFKNTVGTHTITFSYFNNSLPAWCVTMDVTVKAKSAEALEFADSDEFLNSPYYAVSGRRANINSLRYRIRYDNGDYSPYASVGEEMVAVGGGLTENSLLLTEGLYDWDGRGWKKDVAFEAEGVRNTLTIYVLREIPTSIALTSAPNNLQVPRGRTIDLTGANLRIIFNSGVERNIYDFGTSFTAENPNDVSTDRPVGNYTVYAYYVVEGEGEIESFVQWREKAGRYQTFEITVVDNSPESLYQIDAYPDKTAYVYGDALAFDGLEVSFVYSDGVKAYKLTLDDNARNIVEFTNKADETDKVVLKKTDFVAADDIRVYASGRVSLNFLGQTFGYDVTVAPLTKIQMKVENSSSVKTVYAVGEEFDPSGLVLEVRYNNNTTEFYTPDDWRKIASLSEADAHGDGWYYVGNFGSSAGIKTATLVFKKDDSTLTCELTNIIYAQNGIAHIALYSGNELAASLGVVGAGLTPYVGGYTLRAYYNDAEYYSLPLTLDMIDYTAKDVSLGSRRVTVSYNGLYLETTVSVKRATLESVSVKTLPRTDYIVGEQLDLSGGVLARTYENGVLPRDEVAMSEARIIGYNAEPQFTGAYSRQILTVEYEGKTATFDVNVWDKADPNVTFSSLVKIYGNRQPAAVSFAHPNGIFQTPEYKLVYQRQIDGTWVDIADENAPPVSVGSYRVRFVSSENRYYNEITADAGDAYFAEYRVERATITISATPVEKYYGDRDPELTFSASQQELWNSAVREIAASGSLVSAGLTSYGDGREKAAGSYAIERGTLDHPYFNIEFNGANYLIRRKEVEVRLPSLGDMRLIKENGAAVAQTVETRYRLISYNGQGRKVYTDATAEQKAEIDAALTFSYERFTDGAFEAIGAVGADTVGRYRVTITAGDGTNFRISEDSAYYDGENTRIIAEFDIKKMIRPDFSVAADAIELVREANGYRIKLVESAFSQGFANLYVSTNSDNISEMSEVNPDGTTEIVLSSNNILRFKYAETEDYEESRTVSLYIAVQDANL